jgi:tetratricopeptide (TPR) repeat protein
LHPVSGQAPAQSPQNSGRPQLVGKLKENQINSDEARLTAIIAKHPEDVGALSGMGWVRSQQGNFLAAISFLEQALSKRPNDRAIAAALDLDRFRFYMSEARLSLASDDPATAEKRYRSALQIRPDSREALAGLKAAQLRAMHAEASKVVSTAHHNSTELAP